MTPEDLSPETLAALFDQSTDCVKLLDRDGRVLWMNTNGQSVMEIDDFCAVEGAIWTDFWPDDQKPVIEDAIRNGDDTSTTRFRAPCPTAKGRRKWWDVTVSPVKGTDGIHSGYLAISRDISREQATHEALEIALAEMRHRLNNVFATAGSLLSAQANTRSEIDTRAFAEDLMERFDALAEVQTLFHAGGPNIRLMRLITILLAPFTSDVCDTKIGAVPDLKLAGASGDSIALVLGELCVRSARSGAFCNGGSIEISTKVEHGLLELIWTETMVGTAPNTAWTQSKGMSVMKRVLARRGDTLDLSTGQDGLTAAIRVNLPQAA